MSYKQTKSFSESKGGKTKGMCLSNVRLGFGVTNKYGTAWDAWLHTQQHTGTPPAGVDVPVYFSYTTTIDGLRKNWGHIGVRLANGKFWSDGNLYESIAAYEAGHAPRYVGWGESVNDARVIEYVAEPAKPKFSLPAVGSSVQLLPKDVRTTFISGSANETGKKINVTDNSFVYVVRGHDSKFPNRILINSASGGGNNVSLALYYLNGSIIPGWKRV